MKKLIVLLILTVVVVGLIATNPSKQEHKEKIADVWGKALQENMLVGQKGFGRIVGSVVGSVASDLLINSSLDGVAEYHNYGVCSTMTVDGDIISVGALNFIYCGDSKEVSNRIKEKL